jgi:hypothetical protein
MDRDIQFTSKIPEIGIFVGRLSSRVCRLQALTWAVSIAPDAFRAMSRHADLQTIMTQSSGNYCLPGPTSILPMMMISASGLGDWPTKHGIRDGSDGSSAMESEACPLLSHSNSGTPDSQQTHSSSPTNHRLHPVCYVELVNRPDQRADIIIIGGIDVGLSKQ